MEVNSVNGSDCIIGPEIAPENPIGVHQIPFSTKYLAHIENLDGKIETVGEFRSVSEAILAHDLEAIRIYKSAATPHVNRKYIGKFVDRGHKAEAFEVTDEFGTKFRFDNSACQMVADMNSSYNSTLQNTYLFSLGISTKPPIHRSWSDRTGTTSYPTAAFTYEITFHQQRLGMELRMHSVGYSSMAGGRCLGCLVVVDAIAGISTIVQRGDMILRVNDMEAIGSPSEGFNFDDMTKAVASMKPPRTVRFLRLAAKTMNMLPSPAEMRLLTLPSTPLIARFTARAPDPASGQSVPIVELQSMDNQAPNTIKRLMQGQRLVWEAVPGQAAAPLSATSTTSMTPSMTNTNTINMNMNTQQGLVYPAGGQYLSTAASSSSAAGYGNAAANTSIPRTNIAVAGQQTGGQVMYAQAQSQWSQAAQSQQGQQGGHSHGAMSTSSTSLSNAELIRQTNLAAARAVTQSTAGAGVYKEGVKWLALMTIPSSSALSDTAAAVSAGAGGRQSSGRQQFIGRFDHEEEAHIALKQAVEELAQTGSWSAKKQRRSEPQLPQAGQNATQSGLPRTLSSHSIH